MKKLLVSIYLIIPIISHGQNRKLIKPEFLDQNHFFYKIHDNMNSCLYIFYNDTIQYNSYYKSNYDYLYKNSLKTDSIDINLSFDNPIRFLDRKTWFILPRESKIYQLDKKYHFKEFFSKDSIIIFDLYNNYFLSVEKYNNTSNRRNQILYSIDILNGEYKKIIDLRSILSEKPSIQDVFLLQKYNKLLVYTSYLYDDTMDEERYFLFDLNTKKIDEVTDKMQKLNLVDLTWYNIEHQLPRKSFDRFEAFHFNNYLNGYLCTNQKILDQNLNIETLIVERYIKVAGYIYKNDQFESFNLRTWLDDKTDAIIPYRFDANFEKVLYKIYMNELLVENDINQLNSYFYPLLKNFIYAKYNYGFENEYYQAFYNLFGFYRKGRTERKKKVDKLFNKADKANLKLILAKIKQ